MLAIFFTTTQGRIYNPNDKFLEILGYSKEDIQFLDWKKLTPPGYEEIDAKVTEELMTKGVSGPFEKEYFAKNGEKIPLIIGGAFVDPIKKEEALVYMFDARKQKQALEARSRFISDVSHGKKIIKK